MGKLRSQSLTREVELKLRLPPGRGLKWIPRRCVSTDRQRKLPEHKEAAAFSQGAQLAQLQYRHYQRPGYWQ